MPIFYKDNIKILYVHVPKTGGTAIELFFEENGFKIAYLDRGQGEDRGLLNRSRLCSPQHMESAILARLFRFSSFDYIFMTVRHPLGRIISEYKMRASEKRELPEINLWIRRSLRNYNDNPYLLDNHLRPQSEFWVPGCEVFKQEDGFDSAWIDHISRRVSCRFAERKVKVAMKFDIQSAGEADLEGDSIKLLKEFYKTDYMMFGYD